MLVIQNTIRSFFKIIMFILIVFIATTVVKFVF